MKKIILATSLLLSINSWASFVPVISCTSADQSATILVNLNSCTTMNKDRAPTCKAFLKHGNEETNAEVFVFETVLPQTNLNSMMILDKATGGAIGFSGAQTSANIYAGEARFNLNNLSFEGQMSCEKITTPKSIRR